MEEANSGDSSQPRVGIIYDERMCKHRTPNGASHPENPERIRRIWNKLLEHNIPQRCVVLDAKAAEDKYLQLVHSKEHIEFIKNISSKQFSSKRRNASKLNSIYFNQGSSEAAYIAAGSVIEVAERVARGKLNSAAAIVRPPGHHAEHDKAMGFCLFNNVAIATSFILDKRPQLGIRKILIVDWDVHHGNGTQKKFWKDPRVLFFSVHRHDFGSFYPGNDDGHYTMIGEGPGAGYNINVPWENGGCADSDYLAVWDHILIPVAKKFDPDMVIVSAGYDAAVNDPLGGCCLTPCGYSLLLQKLMDLANGKVVLALEGGYNLESIANSFLACMQVLLEGSRPIQIDGSSAYPYESTWRVIKEVRKKLSDYWPVLTDELPLELTSKTRVRKKLSDYWPVLTDELPLELTSKTRHLLISSSDSEGEDERTPNAVSENLEAVIEGIIEPLSKLKVEDSNDQVEGKSITWRSELSKVDIWYATFGSNMWKSRFLCYIEGGQVDGMQKPCAGSMDRTPPKETLWKVLPHRLFFGREFTRTWGLGGVAFLHPESSIHEKTYLCLYRITLEQFNDVLLQENVSNYDMNAPVFDLAALDSISSQGSISLEVFKRGWYHNVVYLGQEQDIPILTMTCPLSNVEGFITGKLPLCAPSKEYANVLVKGLVEGGQLSEDEAIAYIKEASIRLI